MVWQVPLQQGEFNYAIRVNECETAFLWVTFCATCRLIVLNCTNDPPIVASITEVCVAAGDTVRFEVIAYDPNGDPVILSATGGPLEVTIQQRSSSL